jgi:hypothetical protein
MLTDDDVAKIQTLKAKGYSKAKVANTMGLARGTVAKYWGARGERVSLADLKKRFDECFAWWTCPDCRLMYWAPRFMPALECPECRSAHHWKGPQFKEKARNSTTGIRKASPNAAG